MDYLPGLLGLGEIYLGGGRDDPVFRASVLRGDSSWLGLLPSIYDAVLLWDLIWKIKRCQSVGLNVMTVSVGILARDRGNPISRSRLI